jgi:hypothetical protein
VSSEPLHIKKNDPIFVAYTQVLSNAEFADNLQNRNNQELII